MGNVLRVSPDVYKLDYLPSSGHPLSLKLPRSRRLRRDDALVIDLREKPELVCLVHVKKVDHGDSWTSVTARLADWFPLSDLRVSGRFAHDGMKRLGDIETRMCQLAIHADTRGPEQLHFIDRVRPLDGGLEVDWIALPQRWWLTSQYEETPSSGTWRLSNVDRRSASGLSALEGGIVAVHGIDAPPWNDSPAAAELLRGRDREAEELLWDKNRRFLDRLRVLKPTPPEGRSLGAAYAGSPTTSIRSTVHDVGFGDCIELDLPGRKRWVVDANQAAVTCLKKTPRRRGADIDKAVITHPHRDHAEGIVQLVADHRVRQTVLAKNFGAHPYCQSIERHHQRRLTTARVLPEGVASISYPGGVQIVAAVTDLPPRRIASSYYNGYSVILALILGRDRMLLLGDAQNGSPCEASARSLVQFLATLGGSSDAVYAIKVAHHGSSNGILDCFLGLVPSGGRACVSVISLGQRNLGWGHPSQEITDKLRRLGSVWRTDLDGPVVLAWSESRGITVSN